MTGDCGDFRVDDTARTGESGYYLQANGIQKIYRFKTAYFEAFPELSVIAP
jgi:hypothetical protein